MSLKAVLGFLATIGSGLLGLALIAVAIAGVVGLMALLSPVLAPIVDAVFAGNGVLLLLGLWGTYIIGGMNSKRHWPHGVGAFAVIVSGVYLGFAARGDPLGGPLALGMTALAFLGVIWIEDHRQRRQS